MNEIKELLLDAVPPLRTPPDRLAAIRGRAAARRHRHRAGVGLGLLAVAIAVGTTMTVLSPADTSDGISAPSPSYSGPPLPYFPMPAPGACPPSVELKRMPIIGLYPGAPLPTISSVTLCRYAQSTFDLQGENSLKAGPEPGDVNTFRDLLVALTAPRPSFPRVPTSSGCSIETPFTVDVIFVHSADGTTRSVLELRICPTHGLGDPYERLYATLDAVFGAP